MPLPLATWLATLWVTQGCSPACGRERVLLGCGGAGLEEAAARVMECGWKSDKKRVRNDKWLACILVPPLPRATRPVGAACRAHPSHASVAHFSKGTAISLLRLCMSGLR